MKYTLKNEDLNQFNYITDTDYKYHIEGSDSIDDLREALLNNIAETDVIYYSNAMDFLAEEDQSLQESIELALEYGYNLADISSELLATMLLQKRMEEELDDFITTVEESLK